MPVLWWLMAALATCASVPITWNEENIQSATAAMELDGYEYQDKCNSLADVEWTWLKAGAPASGPEELLKMQAEIAMAAQKKYASKYVHESWDIDNDPPNELIDMMDLEGHPGDELLSDLLYQQKLNYTHRVAATYSSTRIPCFRNSTNCNMGLQDVRRVLSRSGDTTELLHTWNQWHTAVKDVADGYIQQLNLTREAAAANEAENPTSYWLHQQELDSGYIVVSYEQAEQLWQEIKPLYTKLHKYVARWLKHQLGDLPNGNNIPAHLLGSLLGEDWSPLADLVSPPDDSTFKDIERGLSNQGLLGKRLFNEAANVMNDMGLPNLPSTFWSGVLFNGTCPTQAVKFCDDQGTLRISTCTEPSWIQYLDAHEWMAKALISHLSSENNVHILRDSNRYNALWDAIPGMISLAAASPFRLSQLNLMPKTIPEKDPNDYSDYSDYNTESNPPNPAVLLLVALRTLPRLPFYLAADQWRLNMLNNDATNTSSWSAFREQYQMIGVPDGSKSDISFLSDPYLISNRPYLIKFLATVLQFQLWDYFTENNPDNPVQSVKDKEELKTVIEKAQSKKWPDVLGDLLAINEISAYSLLQYFQPLNDLLEKEVEKNAPKVQRRVVDLNSFKPVISPNLTAAIWEEPRDQTPSTPQAIQTTENSLPVQVEDIMDMSVVNETLATPHRNITEEIQTEKKTSEAKTAILIASLGVFALALTAGALIAARHCYKRKYQRNRRPPTER